MPTVEQELMAKVHAKVNARTQLGGEAKKKYGIWCHNLPAMIAQCGLAQAVAFMDSKRADAKPGFGELLADLQAVPGLPPVAQNQSFVQAVASWSTADYLFATDRIQRALVYFKRFAISVLGVKAEDAQDKEAGG